MAKLAIRFLSRSRGGADGDPSFFDMHRDRLLRWLNVFLLLLGLTAITSLLAEYGFYLSPELTVYARHANVFVLYGFVAQGIAKLLIIRRRREYVKARWAELVLLLLISLHLLFPSRVEELLFSINPLLQPEALARLYIIITQLLVFVAFIPSALRASKRIMTSNIQPAMLIVLSFLLLSLVGMLLLMLPRATASHSLSLVDALFTATSAVCVTGLIVVDTGTYFTTFGQVILMVLIQVGGLGIMTLTTFFAFILGGGAHLKEYSTLQSLLGEDSLGKIRRTIVQITFVTFSIEAAGAFLLYRFTGGMEFAEEVDRIFFSVFHSISAFCNAGFTLTTENLAHSVLRLNVGVLSTVMALIILGGIGFPVMVNLWSYFFRWGRGHSIRRLSVHTKIVLLTSLVLLVLGVIGIYWLESDRALGALPFGEKLLTALFHSVSARTAGFNTIDTGSLALPTLFLVMMLMWIGASPGSTGGGIKTTTITLALMNIYAIASGRNKVEMFGKKVSELAITKAFSTVLLSFFFIGAALFCLLLTERAPFEALAFEVLSALGTVGLSTGVTPHLSAAGKIVITLCMFAGRVGLLALVIALTRRRLEARYDFTEENVLVT